MARNLFQKSYGMPSGPGAVLGILSWRAKTSSSVKGPTSKSTGPGSHP